ncbi:MAG: DNA polymerase-3 subunit chi [Arenicella sp.]|jgi:DNA polymerase-3 subunit chi
MKQVDFYLISNQVVDAKYKLASRLSNKLARMQLKALIVTDSLEASKQLNKVMWSYSDTSFVAHDHVPSESPAPSKVHITEAPSVSTDLLNDNYDVLINLASEVHAFNHRFERIAEIVLPNEESKAAARERFKSYKSEGFELKTSPVEL